MIIQKCFEFENVLISSTILRVVSNNVGNIVLHKFYLCKIQRHIICYLIYSLLCISFQLKTDYIARYIFRISISTMINVLHCYLSLICNQHHKFSSNLEQALEILRVAVYGNCNLQENSQHDCIKAASMHQSCTINILHMIQITFFTARASKKMAPTF